MPRKREQEIFVDASKSKKGRKRNATPLANGTAINGRRKRRSETQQRLNRFNAQTTDSNNGGRL